MVCLWAATCCVTTTCKGPHHPVMKFARTTRRRTKRYTHISVNQSRILFSKQIRALSRKYLPHLTIFVHIVLKSVVL
jgi:hypothetical protein